MSEAKDTASNPWQTPPQSIQQAPSIDLLLRLLATLPSPSTTSSLVSTLNQHPYLAHAADTNGYSLLHAASSYSHLEVLRALNRAPFEVDVNARDTEGETPLFYAETEETARCLVEELGADWKVKNDDGGDVQQSARQNVEDTEGKEREGWQAVLKYFQSLMSSPHINDRSNGAGVQSGLENSALQGQDMSQEETRHPPPLPPGLTLEMGTINTESNSNDLPPADPEFKRRIEELAARDDFQTEAGQRELQGLVEEALGGLRDDVGSGNGSRRRVQ